MTISHIGIYVEASSLDEMIAWYLAALAPLGYTKKVDLRPQHPVVGLGAWYPDFWIAAHRDSDGPIKEKLHVAFMAKNRQQVRDFYELAMKAGAKDNGPPGLRTHYASTYYAAFVFDPEGRNIEVHTMTPSILSEPKHWNMLVAGTLATVAVGVAYFANVGGYISGFM